MKEGLMHDRFCTEECQKCGGSPCNCDDEEEEKEEQTMPFS